MVLLYLATSFGIVVQLAAVWLPPVALAVVLITAGRVARADRTRTAVRRTVRAVRGTVRAVSARCPRRAPIPPLASVDTCPALSADTGPDVSGLPSDGGSR